MAGRIASCLVALMCLVWVGLALSRPAGPASLAVRVPATPPGWVHRAWTARDHAPRFVQALAQDRDGYLWVGGYEGLFRFDGQDFVPVPPPPGRARAARAVSALAAGADGNVWIGYAAGGGVAVWRDGAIRDASHGLDQGEVTRIVIAPDGAPWVGMGDAPYAVYRLHNGTWEPLRDKHLTLNEGEPGEFGRNGTLWLTTWSNALSFLPQGDRIPSKSPMTLFGGGALAAMPDGTIYAVDRTGLHRVPAYDKGSKGPIALAHPGAAQLPPADFFRAAVDRYGRVWVTTRRSGVVAMVPGFDTVWRFAEADGLSSNRVSPIIADRNGNIWVGGERGLDRFSPTPLVRAPEIPESLRGARVATAIGGAVFVGARNTVWRFPPGAPAAVFRRLPTMIGALCSGGPGDVWALLEDRAMAIAGAHQGAVITLPAPVVDQESCGVTSDGTLWFAAPAHGLFERRGATWRPIALPAPGSPAGLLIDTKDRVLTILDHRSILRLDHGRSMVWDSAASGLERPSSLAAWGNDVLVGGMSGLLRIGDSGLARLEADVHPWLTDVRGIGRTGEMTWILGYNGLMRVPDAALARAFATPAEAVPHANFDEEDHRIGLPQRDSGPQVVVDGDGRAVVLTRADVLVASDWQGHATTPFRLSVRQVEADGKVLAMREGMEIPHGTAALTIAYGVLDLDTPGQRRFRLRIDGGPWADNGERRQVTLANLGPGAHRFEVQTNDAKGGWQSETSGLAFTIRPAFWQTGWFLALAALVLAMLGWLAYRWRLGLAIERVRAANEAQVAERERIARELHDTLMQGVQGLMLRFQAVAEASAMEPARREELEQVLERGDDVLAQARDRVSDLRVHDGEVELLRFLGDGIDRDGTPPVELATEGKPELVCAPVAEEILGIVAEAIANARQHAQADRIAVTVRFRPRHIEVEVSDNGIASAPPQRRKGHFGLQGMAERARRLHARLDVRARPEGGITVSLRLSARVAYRR